MKNNTDIVIFGGLGDLSIRKLLPALYRSEVDEQLADNTRIFLISRRTVSDAECVEKVKDALNEFMRPGEFDGDHWNKYSARIQHVYIELATADESWDVLRETLLQTGNECRVLYFAIPPSIYGQTCAHLDEKGLITPDTRVVLEKPIGYDHESANLINAQVAEFVEEDNIYRIDHYVGKETVQNLLALRFANVLFEPLWDSKTIDKVEITIAESVGLERRSGFYDTAGALRDMVQNHLLQMLCLLTMEPPTKLDADNIRSEKLKVVKALRRIDETDVKINTIRGQYVAGAAGDKSLPSYQEELPDDLKGSKTETYVAIKAHIDNWRWAGVPFYLRTGKRLKERFAEIVIHYKPVSHRVFDEGAGPLQPNRLSFRLQPEESIKLTLMSKELHKQGIELHPATLQLDFDEAFKHNKSDAYQRLMMDAVDGNPALFTHRDEVDAAWAWIDPIIDAWKSEDYTPENYPAGSWGPTSADPWFAGE